FCSSRRRHTRFSRDWSSDVCSSDLRTGEAAASDASRPPATVEILAAGARSSAAKAAVERAKVVAEAVNATRDLVNAAPNDLYPRSEERRVGKAWRTMRSTAT